MWLLLSGMIGFFSFAGEEDVFLKQIYVESKGGQTQIHLEMSKDVDATQLEARFVRRSIEWDLGQVKLKKDKMFIDVNGAEINNIYASNHDSKGLRVRVNLHNDKMASNFHEQLRFVKNKNKMTLIWDTSSPTLTHNISELSRSYDVKEEGLQKMQDHIAEASVIKIDPAATVAAAEMIEPEESSPQKIDDSKEEKDIPLVAKKAGIETQTSSAMGKMAFGMIAVLGLLGAIYFGSKKLNQKRAGAPFNQESIKIVAQKYLGPKRNLTLVRVSGEYLLLGVTDHGISLIKQLTVVDDEIPELLPKDFKTAVKKVESDDEEMESQISSQIASQISDVEDSFSVSSLNDVRKIFQKRKYIDEIDA